MMNQTKNSPTAAICTLGCKVNQYESEAIAEGLKAHGFSIVAFDAAHQADVVIVNTCTVTSESDRKGCQMIRRAVKNGACVIVTGCMAQSQAERASAIPGVYYVCGSRNKLSCVDAAVSYLQNGKPTVTAPTVAVHPIDALGMERMKLTHSGMERTRAYIKIEDGCENRCTYCAIPGARGNVVSKMPEDVIGEVGCLIGNGYREIVLTGIEIASYGKDFCGALEGYHLIDLLEALEAAYPDAPVRYRLGSLEPTYMKPETVSRMAALKHLTPHFHLSLQSGADHVLAGMRRKYNMRMVRGILADIRTKMPDVMFTTDIMTGFPGETEEDFRETMAFAKEAALLHIHVFPYSRRRGTIADTMLQQLQNEEKNRRANALIALQHAIEETIYQTRAQKGGAADFLPETCDGSVVIGHTGNFMEVHVRVSAEEADSVMENKDIRPIRIVGAADLHLIGEFI